MGKIVVDFMDEEDLYGRIFVEREEVQKIEQLLDDYRNQNEEYNIDDFLEILRNKGICFDIISVRADWNIHF